MQIAEKGIGTAYLDIRLQGLDVLSEESKMAEMQVLCSGNLTQFSVKIKAIKGTMMAQGQEER